MLRFHAFMHKVILRKCLQQSLDKVYYLKNCWKSFRRVRESLAGISEGTLPRICGGLTGKISRIAGKIFMSCFAVFTSFT